MLLPITVSARRADDYIAAVRSKARPPVMTTTLGRGSASAVHPREVDQVTARDEHVSVAAAVGLDEAHSRWPVARVGDSITDASHEVMLDQDPRVRQD